MNDDMAVYSKYLKQQMRMVWTLQIFVWRLILIWKIQVVVVVVVVYLTTNQRHVGYLSSGNGHLAVTKIQVIP